jgi:hypothetical protein
MQERTAKALYDLVGKVSVSPSVRQSVWAAESEKKRTAEDSAFVELFFDKQNKKRKRKEGKKKKTQAFSANGDHVRERERERERDLERTEGNKTQSTHPERGGPQKRNRKQQRQYMTTDALATTRSPSSSFALFVSTSFLVGSLSL